MSAPTFAGLSGPWLMRAVTTSATMGFLLFGYDRALSYYISHTKDTNKDLEQRV
jgi:hypothetical protein